jgi:DNA-binding NtrC family response regulator
MDSTASVNLLYVEDNRDLREALSALLAGAGYQVDVADCAGEGLERLHARRFHLVISDYALPDHTGTWMLREAAARGLLDRTETLIVTATADPEDAGGTPVLYKPLEVERLLEHIARLVAPDRAEQSRSAGSLDEQPDG